MPCLLAFSVQSVLISYYYVLISPNIVDALAQRITVSKACRAGTHNVDQRITQGNIKILSFVFVMYHAYFHLDASKKRFVTSD